MTYELATKIWHQYWQTIAWRDDYFLSQCGITPLGRYPRALGTEHLPPIPSGHIRILDSTGSVHDIPEKNIQKAMEIDPNLHVLNPCQSSLTLASGGHPELAEGGEIEAVVDDAINNAPSAGEGGEPNYENADEDENDEDDE